MERSPGPNRLIHIHLRPRHQVADPALGMGVLKDISLGCARTYHTPRVHLSEREIYRCESIIYEQKAFSIAESGFITYACKTEHYIFFMLFTETFQAKTVDGKS